MNIHVDVITILCIFSKLKCLMFMSFIIQENVRRARTWVRLHSSFAIPKLFNVTDDLYSFVIDILCANFKRLVYTPSLYFILHEKNLAKVIFAL